MIRPPLSRKCMRSSPPHVDHDERRRRWISPRNMPISPIASWRPRHRAGAGRSGGNARIGVHARATTHDKYLTDNFGPD